MKDHSTYAPVLVGLLAVIVVIATSVTTYLIVDASRPKPFDPLRYPDSVRGGQHVLSRVAGVEGPAVRVGQRVRVAGSACNLSSKAVAIRGRTFWSIVKPPGVNLLTSHGDALREPGCRTFEYLNEMPASVQHLARERPGAFWRINGDATPTNAHGVTRYWQTQPFRIIP